MSFNHREAPKTMFGTMIDKRRRQILQKVITKHKRIGEH